MEYIHYFESESDFNQERVGSYKEPWVSYTAEKGVDYNRSLLETPLTIVALGSGTFTWLNSKQVSASKNSSEWQTLTCGSTITLSSGDNIELKGSNTSYGQGDTYYTGRTSMSCTAQFNVKGNMMSLVYEDTFPNMVTATSGSFPAFFRDCTTLVSAKDLLLPSTSLSGNAYKQLFLVCTSLVECPEILPAETLQSSCYEQMFCGCSSLVKAPELPALTLTSNSYQGMFRDCSSLNYIKAMFTDPANNYNATFAWVSNVSSAGTFVMNEAATWNVSSIVPSGWTVVRVSY